MRRVVSIALCLGSACGAASPDPVVPSRASCQRLDERAGVTPTARRRCWQQIALGGAAADQGHARARVSALAGRAEAETVSDAPARWGLTPTEGDLLRAPTVRSAPPRDECLARAAVCDRQCVGSAGWSDCLSRCDEELGRCLWTAAPP